MNLKEKLKTIVDGWQEASTQEFKGHLIANLIRKELVEEVRTNIKDIYSSYLVKSSAGAGNWASVPWLAILNPTVTTSTQSGVYPVYLFCADGSGIYLSLGFGTTDLKEKYGARGGREKAAELRNQIRSKDQRLEKWNESIDLRSSTDLGRSYELATAGAKFYPHDAIPDDEKLLSDLNELLDIYSAINLEVQVPEVIVPKTDNHAIISKPFLLLAGISGTGKTRFVREQVKASGSLEDTYCLTSVRPDWHEPSDLLGYVSRIGAAPTYIATDVLKFIVKAWKGIIKSITFNNDGTPCDWRGFDLKDIKPFWLCLDEMNLAPVEQYFSDYLSILETREWNDPKKLAKSGLDYCYECDPLIKGDIFTGLDSEVADEDNKPSDRLAKQLDLDLEKKGDKDIWQYFLHHGIAIPFNLIVAGTVNMDETTHGFSRKVIDRALTFDFGEFFPNDFDAFFEPKVKAKTLSYPTNSDGRNKQALAYTADPEGDLSIQFLTSINSVLENTPFKLAYRALNELLLNVITTKPESEVALQAVWDDFLMCKVLPRIEGDIDKLTKPNSEQNILEQLETVLKSQLNMVWDTKIRPDLYRKTIANEDEVIEIACRSKAKLNWMNQQLQAGFTSFWP